MTETGGQQLLNALAEVQQLRMQLADHGETITRLETEIRALRQDDGAVIAKLQADNARLQRRVDTLEGMLGEMNIAVPDDRALEHKP